MMTPADRVIAQVKKKRYHNHRAERHSDIICDSFINDLITHCPALETDLNRGRVDYSLNVDVSGLTHKVDLMLYEITEDDKEPSLDRARICMENKSVITAHGKNRRNRYSDLADFANVIQSRKSEIIIIGHMLVGTAIKYLNIPDKVKPACTLLGIDFEIDVLPRLSSNDTTLWNEFGKTAKRNRTDDTAKTIKLIQSLPKKEKGFTHERGFDSLLIEPVFIDNIHTPRVERKNPFGIDINQQYLSMLKTTCRAYTARWHTLSN